MCRVAGTRVAYVKPHGALYTTAAVDEVQARAVVDAVAAYDPSLPLLGQPGLGAAAGRDRRPGCRWWPRPSPTAGTPPTGGSCPARTRRRCCTTRTRSPSGSSGSLPRERCWPSTAPSSRVPARSVCTHGDTPGAVALARAVRARLEAAGVTITPFVDSVAVTAGSTPMGVAVEVLPVGDRGPAARGRRPRRGARPRRRPARGPRNRRPGRGATSPTSCRRRAPCCCSPGTERRPGGPAHRRARGSATPCRPSAVGTAVRGTGPAAKSHEVEIAGALRRPRPRRRRPPHRPHHRRGRRRAHRHAVAGRLRRLRARVRLPRRRRPPAAGAAPRPAPAVGAGRCGRPGRGVLRGLPALLAGWLAAARHAREAVLWDVDRDPPALLGPGTTVRFVDVEGRRREPGPRGAGDRPARARRGRRTPRPGRRRGRSLRRRRPRGRTGSAPGWSGTAAGPCGPRGAARRSGRARPGPGHRGAHRCRSLRPPSTAARSPTPPSSSCPTVPSSPSGCRPAACAPTSPCAVASTSRRCSARGRRDTLSGLGPGCRCRSVTCCRWASRAGASPRSTTPPNRVDRPDRPIVLHVGPGPRAAWVGGWATGLGGLLGADRVVAADSDRVGLRLTGSPVRARRTPGATPSCRARGWCAARSSCHRTGEPVGLPGRPPRHRRLPGHRGAHGIRLRPAPRSCARATTVRLTRAASLS